MQDGVVSRYNAETIFSEKAMSMVFWVVRSTVWVLLHLLYIGVGGIRFEGRHHVPRKGGVLITPNHISDADPPTIGVALPRATYFLAKEELFVMPFWGKMIKILRGFPIKRDSADRKALRYAEDRLKEGEAFVIFPEGRISEDGNLIPFLPGVLMIAQRANVPILPVALIGTDNVMPYGEIKPRYAGKRTIVRFGAPVSVSELMGGLKGSAGWQLGAERLSLLVQALQENKPYPKFEAVAEKITVETLS